VRFYTKNHGPYCGIDLHAKTMYLCILDKDGQIVVHRNMKSRPETCLAAVEPFRDDLVVAAGCIFTWYWLADLCRAEGIEFVLGHALYMKAIHGGKAKNDKIDSLKIATLLRGGTLPRAYVYPPEMRATRDLLRRRGRLHAHIQSTHHEYNLTERYDTLIRDLELHLERRAKQHDAQACHRLRTTPGIDKILALTVLYEIHDISRFPRVQDFLFYSRLVSASEHTRASWKMPGIRSV